MQNDINSKGYTQWYFFQVKNSRKGHKVRFNLLNYVISMKYRGSYCFIQGKSDSLYNYGLRPIVYSEKDAENKGLGWSPAGELICYYSNDIVRVHQHIFLKSNLPRSINLTVCTTL